MGGRTPHALNAVAANTARRGWGWALLLITLLGGALRFAALDAKTLWLDEAFSLWMAHHTLPAMVAWIVHIDHHPPLYYELLHLWTAWLGSSPTALRSLSALTSTLAIPLFGAGARRLCGDKVAFAAALLLALSPFQLRYSQETRMYGVLMLVTAAMFLALAPLLTMPRARLRWWVLLVSGEAAAMLTHNTATVLVPLALNGAVLSLWLAQQRGGPAGELTGLQSPRFMRGWAWSQGAAVLLWSPWAWAFVHQAQVVDSDFWIAAPTLWDVWLALGSLTFAHLPAWLPGRDDWVWLALLMVVVGCWQWRRQFAVSWLLLVLWLVPPAVELLVSLRRPIFYDRTLIWTTLPYSVLVARGMVWPAFNRRGWRWRMAWAAATATVVVALCGLGIWGYYAEFAKEDWVEVAAWVAADAEPHSLVLFHASWSVLPFDYYYDDLYDEVTRGKAAPPLTQRGVPADLFDAGALEPPMTAAAVPRVLALIDGQQEVWLVYSHWWYTDPGGLLLQTLGSQMAVADERAWPGIRVIHYVRE